MKYFAVGLVALLVIAVDASLAKDEAPAALDGKAVLAQLKFLAGTWEGPMGPGTFRAQYCPPSADTLLSYSQLRQGGKTTFHEFEVFQLVKGKLVFTPHPEGKPAATFQLTAFDAAAKKATFENPRNEFPSRFVYHRNADSELTITLTAPHQNSDKVLRFNLKRK